MAEKKKKSARMSMKSYELLPECIRIFNKRNGIELNVSQIMDVLVNYYVNSDKDDAQIGNRLPQNSGQFITVPKMPQHDAPEDFKQY